MRFYITALIVCASVVLNAQSIISSNIYIETCINNTQCSSLKNSGYLFYDETSSNLYLKVDFSGFKHQPDSLQNDWLNDLGDNFLYFKVHLAPDFFKGLANNNRKTLKLNGQVFMNNIWQEQATEVTVYSTENSVLSTSNNGNTYDNFKLSFSLSVVPRDFKIHKRSHHLRNTIFVGLALGRINLLAPGSQHLVGEAYDH